MTLLDQLKALSSFAEVGHRIVPHVTSHMAAECLTEANFPLLVELARIIQHSEPNTSGLHSSACCLWFDIPDNKLQQRLDYVKRFREAVGQPDYPIGLGGKPWSSSGSPPPVSQKWWMAEQLAWCEERVKRFRELEPAYCTWDEESLLGLPQSTRTAAMNAMYEAWDNGLPGQWTLIGYRNNTYSTADILDYGLGRWKCDNFYNVDSLKSCRQKMTALAQEEPHLRRAGWLSLNRCYRWPGGGALPVFDNVPTPQQCHALGMEMFGPGCDTYAPWSKLDGLVFYEPAGISETWWVNFLAYAKGVLGMGL